MSEILKARSCHPKLRAPTTFLFERPSLDSKIHELQSDEFKMDNNVSILDLMILHDMH